MDQPQAPYQFQAPPLAPQAMPPMMPVPSSHKGLVVGLVVLAVLVGGYFVAAQNQSWWPFSGEVAISPTPSPTTDPTAGWKTYRNEEYGFEFKYPSAWTEATTGSAYLFSVTDGSATFLVRKPEALTVSLQDYVRNFAKSGTCTQFTSTLINGSSAVRCDTLLTSEEGGMVGKIDEAFIQNGQQVYYVLLGRSAPFLDESYPKTFDQILSTFRFTIPTTSSVAPTSVKDCGAIRVVASGYFLTGSAGGGYEEPTVAERTVMQCMDSALSTCQQAKSTLTDNGQVAETDSIRATAGGCKVSTRVVKTAKTKSCIFPSSVIQHLLTSATAKQLPGSVIANLSFAISFGTTPLTMTDASGNKIALVCSL